MPDETKQATYRRILETLQRLTAGESDAVAVMSTICCELHRAFEHFHWVGFYRRTAPNILKVGPYQGPHGCLTIDIERGVCGACARSGSIQVENDVSKAPSHIACSPATKAEIVLPLCDAGGRVVAVLDVDSTRLDAFDQVDVLCLGRIAALVPLAELSAAGAARG